MKEKKSERMINKSTENQSYYTTNDNLVPIMKHKREHQSIESSMVGTWKIWSTISQSHIKYIKNIITHSNKLKLIDRGLIWKWAGRW